MHAQAGWICRRRWARSGAVTCRKRKVGRSYLVWTRYRGRRRDRRGRSVRGPRTGRRLVEDAQHEYRDFAIEVLWIHNGPVTRVRAVADRGRRDQQAWPHGSGRRWEWRWSSPDKHSGDVGPDQPDATRRAGQATAVAASKRTPIRVELAYSLTGPPSGLLGPPSRKRSWAEARPRGAPRGSQTRQTPA